MKQTPENSSRNEGPEPHREALNEACTFYVQYLPREVNEASWLVYREEQGGKTVLVAFCIAFSLTFFATLIFAGVFSEHYPLDSPTTLAAFVADFLASVAFAFLIWQILKRRSLNTYNKDPRFHLPMFFTIGSGGFQIGLPHATTLVPWQKVAACYELAGSLCLVTDGLIFPLPKRCFDSEQQLLKVRRLIIEKGVRYGTAGKKQGDIVYAHATVLPVDLMNDIKHRLAEAEEQNTANGLDPSSTMDLPTVDAGAGFFDPCHPSSSLISEPLFWRTDTQSLQLECNYTLTELKSVDRVLFFKYTLVQFGILYIALLAYVTIVPAAFVSILGLEYGRNMLLLCLPWAPIMIPGFVIHSLYVIDQRDGALQEIIKLDLPILLELTETACRLRSRRSVMVYHWPVFVGCLATKDHYICRLSVGAVIIPKNVLDDRTKAAFVENLLRRKILKYEDWT